MASHDFRAKQTTYGSILQVNFVADDDEGKVLGVPRRRLDEELVSPRVQRFEGVWCCHIEDQDTAVCASVERHAERLEPFLTSGVPNLHGYDSVIDDHFFSEEICAYCRLVLVAELLVDVLVHKRRFAHTAREKNQ